MCAKIAANTARLYIDEFAVSGLMNAADMGVSQALPLVTCLSDAGPRRVPAGYDHRHSLNGFFDAALTSVGASIWDAIAYGLLQDDDDHYLTELWAGLSDGVVAYDSIVKLDGQPRQAGAGQAHLLNISAQGANGMARGLVIYTATPTGTADGTGRNFGISTTPSVFQAIVRIISGTYTSIAVAIQESSDDAAGDPYATISGMTNTFSSANAPAVVRLTTTATTEAWKRFSITGFTGTSAVMVVTAGLVQGS